MRVLVCGDRNAQDIGFVFDELDRLEAEYGPWLTIITGKCPTGVDKFASQWATDMGIPVEDYPADWKKYGNAAGPIRNQQMLDEGKPNLVVAFPGGRGTANMVKLARAVGVKVIEVS